MKKGFTLLELVVVIIIIGILATLGLTQYSRAIERSRGAEAKSILGSIRNEAAAHYLQFNTLTPPSGTETFDNSRAGIGTANDQIPGPLPANCRNTHYFNYSFNTAGATNQLIATATRCGVTGKGGNSTAGGRTLILTTTFPGGTDTFTGTGGY